MREKTDEDNMKRGLREKIEWRRKRKRKQEKLSKNDAEVMADEVKSSYKKLLFSN